MNNIIISVIGLGYVGLPILSLFSSKYNCWGYDIDADRIIQLKKNIDDRNCSVRLESINKKQLTSSLIDIIGSDIYIVTVPTPINEENRPDISALVTACKAISSQLSKNNIVIFESTVYPGATEEICIPILEKGSGLKLNEDFYVAYSPERINTGDQLHQLKNTPKILGASNDRCFCSVKDLYDSVLDNPVVKASSIKVAEAAKMYENVQRDVLIGLANEYSEFCRTIGIDIHEVTSCASTKWNFSKVFPGLVGGHCIGVDTYYLLEKAESLGQDLQIVRTARETNEDKASRVFERMISALRERNLDPQDTEILILGFSYKKDTSDIRNTKIAPIIKNLETTVKRVDCYDPKVDSQSVKEMYGIDVLTNPSTINKKYNAVFKLVEHSEFSSFDSVNMIDISSLL